MLSVWQISDGLPNCPHAKHSCYIQYIKVITSVRNRCTTRYWITRWWKGTKWWCIKWVNTATVRSEDLVIQKFKWCIPFLSQWRLDMNKNIVSLLDHIRIIWAWNSSQPLAIFWPIFPIWPSKSNLLGQIYCTFPMGKPLIVYSNVLAFKEWPMCRIGTIIFIS